MRFARLRGAERTDASANSVLPEQQSGGMPAPLRPTQRESSSSARTCWVHAAQFPHFDGKGRDAIARDDQRADAAVLIIV